MINKATKLKKAAYEVKYEIDMFNDISDILRNPINNGILNETIHDALVESFGIHAYNLFCFFYQSVSERKNDDIIAEDFDINKGQFIRNRTPKKDLIFIKKKRDKQIAHLTYNRVYRNRRTKDWPWSIINKTRKTIAAFYDSLPDDKRNLFH